MITSNRFTLLNCYLEVLCSKSNDSLLNTLIFRTPVLTVVHFSAEWAEQCKQVTEVLKELLKLPEVQSSGSKIAVCDAEKLSEISLQFKVNIILTFLK